MNDGTCLAEALLKLPGFRVLEVVETDAELVVWSNRGRACVAFATGEPYVSRSRDAGFDPFTAGPSPDQIAANLELLPLAHDLEAIVDCFVL